MKKPLKKYCEFDYFFQKNNYQAVIFFLICFFGIIVFRLLPEIILITAPNSEQLSLFRDYNNNSGNSEVDQLSTIIAGGELIFFLAALLGFFWFAFFAKRRVQIYKILPIFFYVFESLIIQLVFELLLEETDVERRFVYGSIVRLFSFAIFAFFARKYWKASFISIWKKPQSFLLFLSLIIIFFLVFHLSSLLSPGSANEESQSNNQITLERLYKNGNLQFQIFFLFSVILIAPLYEEMFFRFGLFQLSPTKNPFFILCFSTIFFAVVHYKNEFVLKGDFEWENIETFFIFGLAFGLCFKIGRCILLFPIVFHIFQNLGVSIQM